MNKKMSPISFVMACFSLLGALDLIFGNKFGIGKQFERGILLLGTMVTSMVGMIVFAPLIAHLLRPVVNAIYSIIPLEPSVLPTIILANDMGGAPLALEFATNEKVGYFNGLIVASMMGATMCFNIPFSMGVVPKEKHEPLLLGLLCGIVTVPVGCVVSALVLKLSIIDLLASMIPLLLFAIILAVFLFVFPNGCVKVFKVFGVIIKVIILVGLAVGIFEALTGIELIRYTAPVEEGFSVCVNAAMVMSGAFPLIYILSKIIDKPMKKLGGLIGINSASALGFISTLATNVTTYGNMQEMDEKGIMLNSAFSVSAGFVFAGHLAFTLSFNAEYALGMIIGKILSGISAVIVAVILYKYVNKKSKKVTTTPENAVKD